MSEIQARMLSLMMAMHDETPGEHVLREFNRLAELVDNGHVQRAALFQRRELHELMPGSEHPMSRLLKFDSDPKLLRAAEHVATMTRVGNMRALFAALDKPNKASCAAAYPTSVAYSHS